MKMTIKISYEPVSPQALFQFKLIFFFFFFLFKVRLYALHSNMYFWENIIRATQMLVFMAMLDQESKPATTGP